MTPRAPGPVRAGAVVDSGQSDTLYPHITLVPAQGSLATQLEQAIQHARRRHLTPILDVGASWCGPCHALDSVLASAAMRPVVRHLYVIHVDDDLWHWELDNLGVRVTTLPRMVALTADGHPATDPVADIPPSLRQYFAPDSAKDDATIPVIFQAQWHTPVSQLPVARWLNTARHDSTTPFGDGHVYLVVATAWWCGPCQNVYPAVAALPATYAQHGLRVLYLTQLFGRFHAQQGLTAAAEVDSLRGYFAERHVTGPVAITGPEDVAFGNFPKVVVVDGHGIVQGLWLGWSEWEMAEVKATLDTVLNITRDTMRARSPSVPPPAAAGPAEQTVEAAVPDSGQRWLAQLDSLACGDMAPIRRPDCPAQRLAQAESLMAQVDARTPAAWRLRMRMHNRLVDAYGESWGRPDFDLTPARLAHMRTHVDAVLRILAEKPLEWSDYRVATATWGLLINNVLMFTHPDSIPLVVAEAQTALMRYDTTVGAKGAPWYIPWRTRTPPQLTNEFVVGGLMTHWYNYRLKGGGVPAPRLQADAWFPPPGRPSSDTIRPVPGKVNLICTGGEPTDDTVPRPPEWGRAPSQSDLTAEIRHWLKKYGARNLEVTIVYPVDYDSSFSWNTVEGAQARWPGPGKGAEWWRWYIQEHEHLPVTVAVQRHSPQWRETSDRQRVSTPTLQFNDFWMHDPGITHTWGRDGSEIHRSPPWTYFPLQVPGIPPSDSAHWNGPADFPGQCAIVGKDGTMEHTSVESDWWVNTRAAMRLLFEGPGAPPRPGQHSWIAPY